MLRSCNANFGRAIRLAAVSGCLALVLAILGLVTPSFAAVDNRAEELSQALNWKSVWMPVPIMSLGPCKTRPVIDGKLDPGEWNDACGFSTLSYRGASLAYPPAMIWVTHDAEHLYFGYLLHKANPGWLTAKSRFRDASGVYNDQHIEMYISPDPGTGKDIVYQFFVNAYGAISDLLNVPEFGQTNNGYSPKIELKKHETQSEFYVEGAIDVKDLDPQGRFRDGATWRANFGWAWDKAAWSNHGIFWIVRDHSGYLNLDATAPALQWLDAYPLQEGQLDVTVAVKNMTGAARDYRLSATVTGETDKDILSTAEAQISLQPGERKEFHLQGDRAFAGKRAHCALLCSSADGKTSYYQQVFSIDPKNAGALAKTQEAMKQEAPMPQTMNVSVRYGPMSNAIETQADIWNIVRGGIVVDKVHAWVESETAPGKRLVETNLTHFQKDLAVWRADLPKDILPGKYLVKAEALSKDGKTLSSAQAEFTTISLKDPSVNKPYTARPGHILDWIGTTRGVATQIPPPWTPITGNLKTGMSVLNRKIRLDASGLPSQIEAVGKQMLAGPIRYVAVINGKPTVIKPGKVSGLDTDKAGMWASWQGTAGNKALRLTSTAKMEYDGLINYQLGISCPKPITLDALYLDIPLKARIATRIHVPTSQITMPEGSGVVWKSKDVVDNELMNTLISHVWVGDWKCGITFVADQAKGWYEREGESLETVERSGDVVHLKVYFVQGPRQVSATSLEFSLLPTPSTQRPERWREFPYYKDYSYFWAMDWLDTREYENRQGSSIPYWNWDDPSKKDYDELQKEDHSKDKRLLLPYTNPGFYYPAVVPWGLGNASPVNPIMGEEWANMPAHGLHGRPIPSYRDYMTFNYDWYFNMKHYGGFYIDEAYGAEGDDSNMLSGSGWIDRNGNLRGSYHSMDVRELFKRQYAISYQYSPLHRPMMMNHTSWAQSPQYMSHVTCGLLVENLPIGAGECYLDHMPLTTLQFWSGRAWGHYSALSNIGPDEKSARYCLGELMLHDLCAFNFFDQRAQPAAWEKMRKDWGIAENDVTFFGYWEEPKPARTSDESIKVSAFSRPGSVLLVVCNTDIKDAHKASVTIDSKVLGLAKGFTAVDCETGKPVEIPAGTCNVDLGPRDVQYLRLQQ